MATFTVSNLDNSGIGSLRNAIFRSNRADSADVINFDTTLSGGTIGLSSGELRIKDDLSINGLGANFLSVDAGSNPFRVFNVDAGDLDTSIVVFKGLTITGGNATDSGGGISNTENLTIASSTISGNTANSAGGGIDNNYYLTVSNSIISGNTGNFGGGGINNNRYLTVSNSIISGNTGFGAGGIDNSVFFGSATVSNSTISGNTGSFVGGIFN